MAHAHHFLSRLDRVSFEHVELSLSLYRDEGLLRHILASARVPDACNRVAISLAHPEKGPFLVVTREGRFITCLGEGMKAKNLFVVTREKLDAVTYKTEIVRERLAQAAVIARERGGRAELLRRIYVAGAELSREEMTALVAIQPFLWTTFFDWMVDAHNDAVSIREFLLRELRRTDKLASRHDDLVEKYWQISWAMAHLLVLSMAGGPSQFEGLPEETVEKIARLDCTRIALDTGIIAITLRGVWATARLGKLALPFQKRQYDGAQRYIEALGASLALPAIGYRHSRLRAVPGGAEQSRGCRARAPISSGAMTSSSGSRRAGANRSTSRASWPGAESERAPS